ncbi:MAG: transporter substrate-binding domain-containing protein, partial [Candidatus Binatia bacterium]
MHLLVLALICGAACSAVRTPADRTPLPLRVGTSGDYPPFSLRTDTGADAGTYAGFDVTVARAYATERGRALVLVPFRWPELATRLAAGDFDVAMSGVTVRGDRLLTGTLTAAVARADAVVLVRHDEKIAGSFDDPRRRVAVNRGGHLERVARARLPRATLVTVDDNRSLPGLLRDRRVDAVVTDTLEAATYAPGGFTIAARLARDRKAYWVAPGRDPLARDLDAWLLARERDGSLARWRASELHDPRPPSVSPEIARVVDLAARRLLVMPAVAAAKRAANLPLVDPAREATVIARAAERAASAGLDATAARRLAEAQIAAARAVQEATPANAASTVAGDPPTLATIRT